MWPVGKASRSVQARGAVGRGERDHRGDPHPAPITPSNPCTRPVLLLVVFLELLNSCRGQLDASKFDGNFREVGIRPGEFLVFFRAFKKENVIF